MEPPPSFHLPGKTPGLEIGKNMGRKNDWLVGCFLRKFEDGRGGFINLRRKGKSLVITLIRQTDKHPFTIWKTGPGAGILSIPSVCSLHSVYLCLHVRQTRTRIFWFLHENLLIETVHLNITPLIQVGTSRRLATNGAFFLLVCVSTW